MGFPKAVATQAGVKGRSLKAMPAPRAVPVRALAEARRAEARRAVAPPEAVVAWLAAVAQVSEAKVARRQTLRPRVRVMQILGWQLAATSRTTKSQPFANRYLPALPATTALTLVNSWYFAVAQRRLPPTVAIRTSQASTKVTAGGTSGVSLACVSESHERGAAFRDAGSDGHCDRLTLLTRRTTARSED
jgi:hypothetical protein